MFYLQRYSIHLDTSEHDYLSDAERFEKNRNTDYFSACKDSLASRHFSLLKETVVEKRVMKKSFQREQERSLFNRSSTAALEIVTLFSKVYHVYNPSIMLGYYFHL